ncbi:MAG: hypothetical protein ACLFR8_07325 [Alkalispirochaeta sp.]
MLLVVVPGFVWAIRPVDPVDTGAVGASRSVMIVSEWSRYKERLIEAVLDELDDGSTALYVRSFDDLPQIQANDHDAVIVINAGVGSEVRAPVVEWLGTQGGSENIVVLTTQIYDWTPRIEVDSVTSASQNRNIPDVSRDLARQARSYF